QRAGRWDEGSAPLGLHRDRQDGALLANGANEPAHKETPLALDEAGRLASESRLPRRADLVQPKAQQRDGGNATLPPPSPPFWPVLESFRGRDPAARRRGSCAPSSICSVRCWAQ